MFSNLYHLFVLLQESLAFSPVEKQAIFLHAKTSHTDTLRLIQVLEEERIGISSIQNFYKKESEKIRHTFLLTPEGQKQQFEYAENIIQSIRNTEKQEQSSLSSWDFAYIF